MWAMRAKFSLAFSITGLQKTLRSLFLSLSGLNTHREAFRPTIVIEDLFLQRFLHTLLRNANKSADHLYLFTFNLP